MRLFFVQQGGVGKIKKFEEWIIAAGTGSAVRPEKKALLEAWAHDGLSEEQIAGKMHISYSTFKEWKKKYKAFAQAVSEGKEAADVKVENALYQKAIRGDLGAICFYLTNRRPDKWRNKPAGGVIGGEEVKIIDDIPNAPTGK
ncbi:MAG: helix-turn-helix domain-containing protein [Ruminococcaceae bacterium]|nr:helix-turn-helix domain-containing protein [Oscillospiraceae bacterium]